MVKYAVMANIRFETKSDMDAVKAAIPDISLKPIWRENKISEFNDGIFDNKPTLNINVKFENEKDMDDHFNAIKGLIKSIKILNGSRLHMHYCHHDKLPFRPCIIKEEYVISDVSKG